MTRQMFPLSFRRGPISREKKNDQVRQRRPPPRGDMTLHLLHLHHRWRKAGRGIKGEDQGANQRKVRKGGDPEAERWRGGGVPGA